LYATNGQRTVYVPELSAFPNPASDHTFLTYPFEADGIGTLNVFSEMGQLIASHTLNGKGILELNTQNYAAGIYLLSIMVEGKSIVDSKLVVTE
jgi:Secretion system C-terminal sorting domain